MTENEQVDKRKAVLFLVDWGAFPEAFAQSTRHFFENHYAGILLLLSIYEISAERAVRRMFGDFSRRGTLEKSLFIVERKRKRLEGIIRNAQQDGREKHGWFLCRVVIAEHLWLWYGEPSMVISPREEPGLVLWRKAYLERKSRIREKRKSNKLPKESNSDYLQKELF